jgi:hypothetical protein
MFAPLINPWNGIVAIATLLVIEVIKSAFPHHFVNGHGGNRWLRPLCLLGCGIGYQIDGPWITGDMDPWLRLFVGGLVGAATTVGYAGVRVIVKKATAQTKDEVLKSIKKWAAVIGALAALVSGVYGAWFKPEAKAKDSYELVAKAVELVSADLARVNERINTLSRADTTLDKNMAVELARMGQRLDDMQGLLELKFAYKPAEIEVREPPAVVVSEPMHVVGETEVTVASDEPKAKAEIKRKGLTIQMPSAQEVGF